MKRRWLGCVAFFTVSFAWSHAADKDIVNLLRLPKAAIETTTAPASQAAILKMIADDKGVTPVTIPATVDSPIELVYGFGDATIAPEKLIVKLPDRTPPGAATPRVEILASRVSPYAGFRSLLVSPVQATPKPQEFDIPPTAAKWLMLRFTPPEKGTQVALAQVSVIGRVGPPANADPAKEAAITGWIEKAIAAMDAGKDEEALDTFKKAAVAVPDGDFVAMQAWVFIRNGEAKAKTGAWEAALKASESGLAKLDAPPKKELERWRVGLLLRWADAEVKLGHYSDAFTVIDRGIAIDPKENRFQNRLGHLTQEWARDLLAKEGKDKAKEVLATLLKTYPKNRDVQSAAQGHVRRFVRSLLDAGKYEDALAAISDHTTIVNDANEERDLARGAYYAWAESKKKSSDYEGAVALYAKAMEKYANDFFFETNLAATFDGWAQTFAVQKDYIAAVGVYEKGLTQFPANRTIKTNFGYFVQELAKDLTAKDGEEKTREVLLALIKKYPQQPALREPARGHVHRVVKTRLDAEKYEDALAALDKNAELLPEKKDAANQAHIIYDAWASSFRQKKQWQEAVNVYAKGLQKLPKDSHLENNAVVTWNAWARTFIDAKDWKAAIRIYEMAMKQFPKNGTLKTNWEYCVKQGMMV